MIRHTAPSIMLEKGRQMGTDNVEIVLVEDNPSDAELIMRVFKKHNLANEIVLLKDGAEALDFFFGENGKDSNVKARLIVLDLKLPKVDGIEVLRRIKSDPQIKETPVIVLTSSQEDKDLKAAYDARANSYVTKPIDFKDFARVVSDLEMYWLLVNKHPRGKSVK